MLGQNPIRKQSFGNGLQLWVQEIFYTLQGEGPNVGSPALFVRLSGCNLRCYWCDTDFESSTWHPSLAQVMDKISQIRPTHCQLIVITGGEPFRQNITPLVTALLDKGLSVQIETNGSLWQELPKHAALSIVCSPKTGQLHEKIIPRITAFKYVIAQGETDAGNGLPAYSTQVKGKQVKLFQPSKHKRAIYVMPRDDGHAKLNAANRRACTAIALKHGYRLCLQTHKILGLK